MVFSNNLLMGAAGQSTGYEIEQSIRFNFSDAPSLLRTPGSASNQKTWTWSAWVKRSGLGNPGGPNSVHQLFGVGAGSCLRFTPADALRLETPAGNHTFVTSQVFRDTSAWYHIVLAFDSTQATDTNRRKLYVNGSQVTSFSSTTFTGLAQNADWGINSTSEHQIGKTNLADYFGGYMAEIQLVDGTALAPTAFGETNDDGVWIPKAYSGAYGTNGYFIDGRDSSDLGDDESGNGNDYASSGLTTADQMPDTPTLNAATLNPLWKTAATVLSDGNLVAKNGSGNTYQRAISTFAIDDGGKYACEFQKSAGTFGYVGVFQVGNNNVTSGNNYMFAINLGNGEVVKNSSVLIDVGAAPANSLMRIEYDSSNDTIKIFDDGTEIFPAATGVSNVTGLTGQDSLHFGCAMFATNTIITATFQGLSGTPTADFLELTSANLATPTIADGSKYFQPALYTGSTSAQDITFGGNSDLAPDWLWFKARSAGSDNFLFDKVRGALKTISSNDNTAEESSTGSMTAFGTDGFSLGDGGTANDINGVDGTTYVAWGWAANGAGSSNEDGSINTTATSANTTAGFSVSTYTGTGANATVGHGLGIAPSLVIIKSRNDTHDWYVWTPALSGTEFLVLNTTAAKGTASPEVWNSTVPTSTIVNIGTSIGVNRSSYNYVMYAFAEIPGYSKFGSYEGNANANGTFVYTGFKPSFVITKSIDQTTAWPIADSVRAPFNVANATVFANQTTAETTGYSIDILSNGFKARTTDTAVNSSTMIYIAFAENPFGGDGVAPATAR